MDARIFQRIRENLLRQRRNLLDWLQYTPNSKKQIHLGPAEETAVQAHLQILDTALAKAEDKTLGICKICHDYIEPDRLEMDFTANVCLSHYSVEDMRRLEAELELAHKVHKALLPQELPQIPGLQLAAFIQPADIVGGDYFDFFRFRDGAFFIQPDVQYILDPGGTGQVPDALVVGVERGLLVTDFWYTRVLDPRTMVVTGLTRNGVWLIEDGRVGPPVTNMRFTQSYLDALGPGAIRGVGSDATLVGGAAFDIGGYVVPSLHLASWNFTGGAKG